jgi:hypothetical protein
MQISELESKVSKLSTDRTLTGQSVTPSGSSGGTGARVFNTDKYIFELWSLKKVDSKDEHNMFEWDGKFWYWCNNHTYNNKGVVTQGMHVFHKPDSEHDAWQAKKDQFKKGGPKKSTVTTPKASISVSGLTDPSAAKLSLSKSLQAALVMLVCLLINTRKSEQKLAMSQETKWPQM